jgi:hypothetical protein
VSYALNEHGHYYAADELVLGEDETIQSRVFDGLEIDLKEIFMALG